MVILDTDLLVGVLRGDDAATQCLITLQKKHKNICVSTVTIFELLRGIQRSTNRDANRVKYLEIMGSIYAIEFTYFEADIAGKIDAFHMKAGTPIGLLDTMIAATCITTKMPLVTRNVKHYAKIPGLQVETW